MSEHLDDQESKIEKLRRAVKDEGAYPVYHRYIMSRHRKEWPSLWAAIDDLLMP